MSRISTESEYETLKHRMIATRHEMLATINEMRAKYGDAAVAKTLVEDGNPLRFPRRWLHERAQRNLLEELEKLGWKP